jgi:hypothetical protein
MREFFEAENGRLSMTRLLMFLSFPPSTFVLVHSMDSDALGWYLGAYVTGYALGKGADALGSKKGGE